MIEHIIKEAGECGACEKWYNNTNRNNLLEKYIMNVDWCMESGYPTKETFRQNTSEEELLEHNIYNYRTKELVLENGTYIFNWSDCELYVPEWTYSTIHAGNNTILNINVKKKSKLYIYAYSNALIRIFVESNAQCVIYKKGDSKIDIKGGDVIVKYDKY